MFLLPKGVLPRQPGPIAQFLSYLYLFKYILLQCLSTIKHHSQLWQNGSEGKCVLPGLNEIRN